MKNLQESLKSILRELCSGKSILVGVSGGADSMALAEILHSAGYTIEIAHCHFNLREIDADSDQAFVQNYATQLGVPFHTIKFETQSYADKNQVSIQMAARSLRYEWFEKIRVERSLDKIAVGTHLTDNIETFLLNSIRGTGLRGLRGIKMENGHIIRPLIQTTKQEIYDYVRSQGLDWVEDQSNKSVKYHRNKIRHDVLPHMKEINPNLEPTFNRNFKRLGRLDAFVEQEVDLVWAAWVNHTDTALEISISKIKAHDFADVVLNRKLDVFGFNPTHVDDLLNTLNTNLFVGKQIKSDQYLMIVDREVIYLNSIEPSVLDQEVLIDQNTSNLQDPLRLEFKRSSRKDLSFKRDHSIAYFDLEKLQFPIKLRRWQKGDRIHPFGMKGVKKVSDLLIDNKIPLHKKDHVWVLESQEEIIWVVGVRASERFKVDTNSKEVYQINILK